jgi:hypothetical protein
VPTLLSTSEEDSSSSDGDLSGAAPNDKPGRTRGNGITKEEKRWLLKDCE